MSTSELSNVSPAARLTTRTEIQTFMAPHVAEMSKFVVEQQERLKVLNGVVATQAFGKVMTPSRVWEVATHAAHGLLSTVTLGMVNPLYTSRNIARPFTNLHDDWKVAARPATISLNPNGFAVRDLGDFVKRYPGQLDEKMFSDSSPLDQMGYTVLFNHPSTGKSSLSLTFDVGSQSLKVQTGDGYDVYTQSDFKGDIKPVLESWFRQYGRTYAPVVAADARLLHAPG